MSLANRSRSTSPSQNSGTDSASRAVPIEKRSRKEWRRSAEMIPTESPPTTHRTAAPTVNDNVAGSRSMIRLLTDSWL